MARSSNRFIDFKHDVRRAASQPLLRDNGTDPEGHVTVAYRVRTIIVAQLGVDEADVTWDASLDDLGADSLDAVELALAFEQAFGIDLADEDIRKIWRVKEAVRHIEAQTERRRWRALEGLEPVVRRSRPTPSGRGLKR